MRQSSVFTFKNTLFLSIIRNNCFRMRQSSVLKLKNTLFLSIKKYFFTTNGVRRTSLLERDFN